MFTYIICALIILFLIIMFYMNTRESFGVWNQFVRDHHIKDQYNTCGLTQLNLEQPCDNGPHDGFR